MQEQADQLMPAMVDNQKIKEAVANLVIIWAEKGRFWRCGELLLSPVCEMKEFRQDHVTAI